MVGVDENKLFELVLTPMSQVHQPPVDKRDMIRIHGTVVRSYENRIYIELFGAPRKINTRDLYSLEFICNRLPVQMERQAMYFMEEHELTEFFFAERSGVNDLVMGKLSSQMENLNINKM